MFRSRALPLVLSTLMFSGCGGDDLTNPIVDAGGDGGSTPTPFEVTGWATMRSNSPGTGNVYHSGFDGTNEYQVPLAFVGTGEVTFAVTNGAIAEAGTQLALTKAQVPQLPDGVTLNIIVMETKSVGTTNVTATLAGQTYTAQLVVQQYTPADVTLGDQRYNTPANANDMDRRACASCHTGLGKHSTAFLSDLTDAEILQTAVDGTPIQVRDPETGDIKSYEPLDGAHMFNVTQQERVGIAAYLRSRDPLYQLPMF